MRKPILILFVWSFLLIQATQILYPSTASAEDVWFMTDYKAAGTGTRGDYYISTEHIRDIEIGFIVGVKLVVNGKLRQSREYIFRYMDDDSYGAWYYKHKHSSGDYTQVRYSDFGRKVFQASIPYAKYAKKYPHIP